MQTHADQLTTLSQQIRELSELLIKSPCGAQKHCLTVEDLAARWMLNTETVRRLVRDGKLNPLHSVRPFRFTLAEVHRFEALTDPVDTVPITSARRPRK